MARFNLKLWTLNERIRWTFSVGQILIWVSKQHNMYTCTVYHVPCTCNMCIIYNQHLDGNSAKGITALIYSSNKRWNEEKKMHKIRMDPLKCIPYASTVIVHRTESKRISLETRSHYFISIDGLKRVQCKPKPAINHVRYSVKIEIEERHFLYQKKKMKRKKNTKKHTAKWTRASDLSCTLKNQ